MLQIRNYFGLVAFKFMKCYELKWITLKYRHSNFYPQLWRDKNPLNKFLSDLNINIHSFLLD